MLYANQNRNLHFIKPSTVLQEPTILALQLVLQVCPMLVKHAENHLPNDSPLSKDSTSKCINCSDKYTATKENAQLLFKLNLINFLEDSKLRLLAHSNSTPFYLILEIFQPKSKQSQTKCLKMHMPTQHLKKRQAPIPTVS